MKRSFSLCQCLQLALFLGITRTNMGELCAEPQFYGKAYSIVQLKSNKEKLRIRTHPSRGKDSIICEVTTTDKNSEDANYYAVTKVRKVGDDYWCKVDIRGHSGCDTDDPDQEAWVSSIIVNNLPLQVFDQEYMRKRIILDFQGRQSSGYDYASCKNGVLHKALKGIIKSTKNSVKPSLPIAMFECPKGKCYISSNFAFKRNHKVHGRSVPHKGIDIAAPKGTQVQSSSSGKLRMLRWVNGYGLKLVMENDMPSSAPEYMDTTNIEDDPGADPTSWMKFNNERVCGLPMIVPVERVYTDYNHLSPKTIDLYSSQFKVKNAYFDQPEQIDSQTKIAYSGNTGTGTGPHLHFELVVVMSRRHKLPWQLKNKCLGMHVPAIRTKMTKIREEVFIPSHILNGISWYDLNRKKSKYFYCEPRKYIDFPGAKPET